MTASAKAAFPFHFFSGTVLNFSLLTSLFFRAIPYTLSLSRSKSDVNYCPTLHDPTRATFAVPRVAKSSIKKSFVMNLPSLRINTVRTDWVVQSLGNIESGYSASHQRTLAKGRDEIKHIVNWLDVPGGGSITDEAHRFYHIAVDKNFTRGRRTTHVATACVYIACRYVLGAVFCNCIKFCSLQSIRLFKSSLIQVFLSTGLLGEKNNAVSEAALRIIASMKRDWMQTGRKPSGLCGAALYIATLSHGFDYSKIEIVNVVHVCEATLKKRLITLLNGPCIKS